MYPVQTQIKTVDQVLHCFLLEKRTKCIQIIKYKFKTFNRHFLVISISIHFKNWLATTRRKKHTANRPFDSTRPKLINNSTKESHNGRSLRKVTTNYDGTRITTSTLQPKITLKRRMKIESHLERLETVPSRKRDVRLQRKSPSDENKEVRTEHLLSP